ncbi:SagB family peptide dehydrogenase [Nonomuraea sp. NPDC052116]|uniref:SagB family peptide dehydrogenase n=1 Tax=Nonomuraea sp. NPDC052116 TaxID=3155665 RepID=UPI003433FE2C
MTQAAFRRTLRLLPHVRALVADGRLHVVTQLRTASLGPAAPDKRALLRHLSAGLPDRETHDDLVQQLLRQGWLSITVEQRGHPLYTLRPHRPPPAPPPQQPAAKLCLSRFALITKQNATMVVDSPRSWCALLVHDPQTLATLAGLPANQDDVPDHLLKDLVWARLAVPHGQEEEDFRLRQWSPHELWFHARSRTVRDTPFGVTWWARERFAPLPARHDPFPGPQVDLHAPDLARLRRDDPTVTTVLEDRRSIRDHDETRPLTAAQLGEFLYRCGRDTGAYLRDAVEHVRRPHPSGGASHELEIYPLIRHADGLDQGLYHYDPATHRLEQVAPMTAAVRRLLQVTAACARTTTPPQVLLVIAARFGRVMWKYQEMAYALILKDVGVLTQTMYTVATAMGLAPCAIGGAGATEFADATGLDPMTESSLGEFTLGTRRPDHPGERPTP